MRGESGGINFIMENIIFTLGLLTAMLFAALNA